MPIPTFYMLDRIIHFLRRAEGYISGEEISRELNITRSAIWKYIQDLRQQGYDIVAVPHLGYRMVSAPDKLLPSEIGFELKTKILGSNIVYYESVGSTMDEAFRLGMEGAPEGTVVCAETQLKGRGRLGRSWSSPKGKGVYMSIILRPKLAPIQMSKLTLLCAVAVSEALEEMAPVQVAIKWPNDLLIHGKKIAGILTELRAEVDQVKFVIMGIGININNTPTQLLDIATSLKQEAKTSFSRVEVMKAVLRRLEAWYLRLAKEGFDPVLARWKEKTTTLKKRVRITDPAGAIEGEAIDLDQDGGLLIRQDSGVVIKRMAGDVVMLR